jgi:DNA-binding CsgD family transcriptional regulator
MTTPRASLARARDEVVERAGRAQDVGDLFASVSERLRRLVAFDAAEWLALDPETGLPSAPARSENLGAACPADGQAFLRFWELEFLREDVNLYRDLARADDPVAGLRLTTGDRPWRSLRYCDFMRPFEFDDELRAVLRVDGYAWAWVGLYRERGRPAFEPRDAELLASLSRPLAAAVRERARPAIETHAPADGAGVGVLLFAPTGELLSINDDALAWLDQLPAPNHARFSVSLPVVAVSALLRARALAEQRDHGAARARVRAPASGRWLVFEASCLREPDGEIGNTALLIEPAGASDIAPLLMQAYELSPREEELTRLIAQGAGTAEIATRMYLSRHTVRDYIKSVFEKVGVSSRGELVAKLFAEHYAPADQDGELHVRVNTA